MRLQRLLCLLFLAGLLAACATRTPPPAAEGRFYPVNGDEQTDMKRPPDMRSHGCPANQKPHLC